MQSVSAPSPMSRVAAVRPRQPLQLRRHVRPALLQHRHQLLGDRHIVRRQQREGHPACPGTPSSTDPMHIVFRLRGRVVVDDGAHVLDVEPAARHVRRDQNVGAALLELLQRPIALLLALVAMDRLGGEAAPAQVLVQALASALLLAEDDQLRTTVVDRLQDANGARVLLIFFTHLEALVDRVGRAEVCGVVDGDHQRVNQEGVGEGRDLFGPGRRPHEGLPRGSVRLLHDGFELRLEAEVEHPVGLVKHEEGAPAQVGLCCVHEIEQPAWRGNADLHTMLQVTQLRPFRDAAVDSSVLHSRRHAEAVALAFDLQGKLSRWGEHERNRAISRLQVVLRVDMNNCGQSEAEGLARTCGSQPNQVAPAERNRPRLALYRRRPGEATALELGRQKLWEGSLNERAHRLRHFARSTHSHFRVPPP
mmetsp:Transcript_43051/g.100889  ORF Transcript_43051/g.100889 Transcript_43051/m.100889 type:complete len:421 (+) Transcript_43051:370-1632(+)